MKLIENPIILKPIKFKILFLCTEELIYNSKTNLLEELFGKYTFLTQTPNLLLPSSFL